MPLKLAKAHTLRAGTVTFCYELPEKERMHNLPRIKT